MSLQLGALEEHDSGIGNDFLSLTGLVPDTQPGFPGLKEGLRLQCGSL